jgi:hypothetical protein
MSLSEKSSGSPFPLIPSAPSEQTLLAVIAASFIVLHLFAMTMLAPTHQSSTTEPVASDAPLSGD